MTSNIFYQMTSRHMVASGKLHSLPEDEDEAVQ